MYKNVYSEKIKNYGDKQLPQTEKQEGSRSSEITATATAFLRGKGRTDEKNTSDGQKRELELFAKETEFWIEDYEKLGEYIGKGMESQVFLSEDGNKVYKVNDLEFYDTPLGYLNTINEHNNLFPEAPYKVIGFTKRKDTGNFSFVLEQPFIEAERGATQEEINSEMDKLGFTKSVSELIFTKDNIEVLDLHEGNVIVDKLGNIFFIDPVIFVKETSKVEIEITDEDIKELVQSGAITYTDEDLNPCAKNGIRGHNFTKGSKWELVEDLKGASHNDGGIDLQIGEKGVTFKKQSGTQITAEDGMLVPFKEKDNFNYEIPFLDDSLLLKTKNPASVKIAQDKIKKEFELWKQKNLSL